MHNEKYIRLQAERRVASSGCSKQSQYNINSLREEIPPPKYSYKYVIFMSVLVVCGGDDDRHEITLTVDLPIDLNEGSSFGMYLGVEPSHLEYIRIPPQLSCISPRYFF